MSKYRIPHRTILLLWLVACTGIHVQAQSTQRRYHITDLGTLGGPFTTGTSINASGQVAGYGFTTGFNNIYGANAFLWTPTTSNGVHGTLKDLGTSSIGHGVNVSGWVTGTLENRAFLYDGAIHDLGTLGGTDSQGFAINDNGQVTGGSLTTEGVLHAFLYDGTMHDLGTLGGTGSYGLGINSSGQVTGDSHLAGDLVLHAFLYDGAMHDLGTLGGDQSGGNAVNDSGQVTGYSDTTGDPFAFHAFLYDGSMHDLGTLGGTHSYGNGINSNGQIVGDSERAGDVMNHAFLYASGIGMIDLNTLIDPLLGWELINAKAINDAGQITGYEVIGGEERAFLLTPIPEPSAVLLVFLGVIALRIRRRATRLATSVHGRVIQPKSSHCL